VLKVHATAGSRAYDALIGRTCLPGLGTAVRRVAPGGQAVVCSDENVAPLYLEAATSSLAAAGFAVSWIVIPAGERQKSLARAEELYGVLYDRGVKRTDTVVALGGGVVGDLAGFVAATFQRGVRLIQVPTTLLAQVDASAGGKVAVDFRAGKNYVGTFYQPSLVFIDVATLETLPQRELKSGAAEVAKHALLAGGDLLAATERLSRAAAGSPQAAAVTQSLVAGNVWYKVSVVRADEREESGARAALNLGHTVAHAIEAATGFARYTHGAAVALGLRAALRLSERLCGLSPEEAARGVRLLDGLGLPARLTGVSAQDVSALIGRDKKAAEGGVGFVLLEALGRPITGAAVPGPLQEEVVQWLTRP